MSNYQSEPAVIDRGNNGNGGVKILSAEEQKLLEEAVKNGDRDKYIEILQIKIIEDPHEDLSGVLYPIGKEPENLKSRLDTLLSKIDAAYPFKIVFNLQKDQKTRAETLTDLYRKLGYPSGRALLRAYGFTIAEKIFSGNNDYNKFIDLLKQKYPDGSTFKSVSEIAEACPELDIKWKSWQNNAQKLYGMSLKDYLISNGILKEKIVASKDNGWVAIEKSVDAMRRAVECGFSGAEKPETLAQLFDWFTKKNSPTIKAYIKEDLNDVSTSDFTKVVAVMERTPEKVSKAHIDSALNLIKGKYITAYALPKNCDEFISDNAELLGVDFEADFALAYPNESIENVLLNKKLLRPEIDVLRERLKTQLRKMYQKTNVLFDVTAENVKKEFGISLDEFYYMVFPGRESDYERSFDDFLKVFCSYTNIGSEPVRYKSALSCLAKIYNKIREENVSFSSISELKETFTDISWETFSFNIQTSCYRKNIEQFLCEAGVFSSDEYYTRPMLENLQKKRCVLDVANEKLRNIVDSILKIYGAKIVTDDADFIITDDYSVGSSDSTHSKIIEQSIDEMHKIAKPKLVLAGMLDAMENISLMETGLEITGIDLSELSGKGCLIDDCFWDDTKTEIRSILTRYGASIKRTFSKNVDYIVSWEGDCFDIRCYSAEMKSAAKVYAEKGTPHIISGYGLISQSKQLVTEKFNSMNKEEKLQYAIELYELCVSKIKVMMDRTNEYNNPTCTQDTEIICVLCENAKIEDADEFFDVISSRNRSWGDNYNEIAQTYKEKYRRTFVKSERCFASSGCSLDGVIGYECPVALAVAGFVYGSPENSVDVEFTRDKWEWRGDYCSSFYVAFELSSSYPEGRVYKSLQHKYSSM